jgi:hypothetical protein
MATAESALRPLRTCSPPATEESAANPVTVSVKTVVVTSGTPSLRTMALRIPIAMAVSVTSAYAIDAGGGPVRPSGTPAAINKAAYFERIGRQNDERR